MIYVLRVTSGKEKNCIDFMKKYYSEISSNFYFPERELLILRKGCKVKELKPLFPGYVFYETRKINSEEITIINDYSYFISFLPKGSDPRPVLKNEEIVLKTLFNFGSIIEVSKVQFDENKKIFVKRGPMKGLEGRIVKVDRRKNRVKIKFDLYESPFLIDLGFEMIGEHD